MMLESIALPATYRALVMTADNRMSLEERLGSGPRPGDVAIEVIATGICGSDVHGLAGDTGRRIDGQVMGHETVGRIAEIGEGVAGQLLGQVVTVNPVFGCGACEACTADQTQRCENGWVLGVRADVDGAFAERFTVPAANIVPIPPGMAPWHGALVEPLSVGHHAVMRGAPTPRDRVLVIGGGPIGQAAALAAGRAGVAAIIVSEPDPGRAGTVRRLGFTTTSPDDLAEAMRSEGIGSATLVIDAVGNDRTLATAFDRSTSDARVVLVGMASPELRFQAYQVSAKERTLIGAFCYSPDEFRSTAGWLAEHPRLAEILVDRIEPLERGVDVFDQLLAGGSLPNKVLLAPRPQELQ